MRILKKILRNPKRALISGIVMIFGKHIPDSLFIRLRYYLEFGCWPDLNAPKTFNEKLQWLKLHNRKPQYTNMVDKIEVKKWVADRIGEEYIIPTLAVYTNAEEIDFEKLPDQFVLKCNHDSGGLFICKDKNKLTDEQKMNIKIRLNNTLKKDYYIAGREWPYKNVRRRILAEQYMEDESGYELKDYKIYCFNGKPEFIHVDFDRFASSGHKRNLYDLNWNLLEFEYGYPSDKAHIIEKPYALEEMLRLAKILSEGVPFLRVDFYYISNQSKFGETTFFPECGFGKFSNIEIDETYGAKIKLPTMNTQSKKGERGGG